ncbi:MAG: 16S rRNA (guanine(527)-N(7))-methyltransferase RsmG [Bacteroidales bacterium]|nr:16S rRNA (guanine(527)-N(7))-methyltransferase RsmG [Bacteroidales bacterium]
MDYDVFEALFEQEWGSLTEEQKRRFRAVDALYRDWNSKINVISRKDMDGIYAHHVLHSLGIALYLLNRRPEVLEKWKAGGVKVLDLGTGGGFPGIPLAILFPKVKFTLCDSIAKKITVASSVASALGLENVECVNARAESLPGKYDWVVSRAVTSLDNFLPWVKGRYSEGILYLKGGDVNEEIANAMMKFRLPAGSVSTWRLDNVVGDTWYEGKLVLEVARF